MTPLYWASADMWFHDMDDDGDLDRVGTSLTRGQAFIVEQVRPDHSLVATVSPPDGFQGNIKQLVLTLATEVSVTGMPASVLVTIDYMAASDRRTFGQGQVDSWRPRRRSAPRVVDLSRLMTEAECPLSSLSSGSRSRSDRVAGSPLHVATVD